jgi:internalin A
MQAVTLATVLPCLLCALLATPVSALGIQPIVVFPDANLATAVHSTLSIPTSTPIYASDMAALTALTARNAGIVQLDGLQWATNLDHLDLQGDHIATITALSGLTGLHYLNLGDNDITTITPVSGLTNLTDLYLGDNRITDIAAVSGLAKLRTLDLGVNDGLATITPVGGLTNLTVLYLESDHIADIAPVSALTTLTSLDLAGNAELATITPVSGLTNLTWLNLGNDRITTITPVGALTNLTTLYIQNNRIADISALGNLKQLQTLYVGQNPSVTNVSALTGLTTLSQLDLGYDPIPDISPLAGLTNLTSLDLVDNQTLVDISPLSHLTKLDWLDIAGNQIYDITPLDNLNGAAKDDIYVGDNWLDLTPGSQSAATLSALAQKGYTVSTAPGQNVGGAMVGSVHSATGAVLSGVSVDLTDGPGTLTALNGAYVIGLAEPGLWTITFTKPYYYPYSKITAVTVGATSTVDAVLSPVQLSLSISRSPSGSSVSFKRKKGAAKFTLFATFSDARGAVSGATVWLQKSSKGAKWSNLYKLSTNSSGKVSKAFSAKKSGTTYYRWSAAATASDHAGVTSKQKVVVK